MISPHRRTALIAILLGFFIVMLDTTIVNVALAGIGADLDTTVASLQWVVDAYTLVFAAFLLTAGAACDRLGARKVYVAGLIILAAFSVVCALAPTSGLLVAGRSVQGLGAAALVPGSLALLSAVYDDPEEQARAIGLWGGAGGCRCSSRACPWRSARVGDRLAGRVLGQPPLHRHWLFAHFMGNSRSQRWSEETGGHGRTSALSVYSHGSHLCHHHCRLAWMAAVADRRIHRGCRFLAVFIIVERRQPDPMLPTALFSHLRFSAAAVVGLVLNVSFFGQLFVLSLFFQEYMGTHRGLLVSHWRRRRAVPWSRHRWAAVPRLAGARFPRCSWGR